MKKYVPILLSIILFGHCQSKQESAEDEGSKQDKLYQEVIDIHDEAMPQLATISDLMEKIESKVGELEQSKNDSTLLTTLRTQLEQLDAADEAMMSWMRAFEANYDGWEEDSITSYLQAQKTKIFEVNLAITSAIEDARQLVE